MCDEIRECTYPPHPLCSQHQKGGLAGLGLVRISQAVHLLYVTQVGFIELANMELSDDRDIAITMCCDVCVQVKSF